MIHRHVWLSAALGGVFPAVCAAAAGPAQPQVCDASGVCTTGRVPAAVAGGKQMWASSRAFTDAPPLEVEKWLAGKPETDGKFVVIEFWRTWCGACKRLTPLMNTLQKKFGEELVVIGITGESEEKVKAYNGPKKEYFLAIDRPLPNEEQVAVTPDASRTVAEGPDTAASQTVTVHPDQGRYEAHFGVWGWPHVVILEPQYRTVIWEGFPGLEGYELTEAKIERILAIGRQGKK
jgi:thiol-disulfide isomerase/thioredoxin